MHDANWDVIMPNVRNIQDIPKRIPSAISDQLVAHLSFAIDLMIQLELEFNNKLDVERLSKAIDIALDAEPVLGCRWVPHWRKPGWERLDRSERHSFWLVDSQDKYEAFKGKSIDSHIGPQIRACLWQSSNDDHLVLKVSHIVADAGGVKEIAGTISTIYAQLVHDPNCLPEPNLRGSRGIWQVLRYIPWRAYPGIYLDFLRETQHLVRAPHGTYTLPIADGPREPLTFVSRFLTANRVSYLVDYGRVHNATLNDVMLAAYVRASALRGDWDGRSRLMVATSVDLRQRYLPTKKAEAICNLSAVEYPDLDTDVGHNFAATVERVCAVMRRRKAGWMGVEGWLGQLPLTMLPYSWRARFYRKVAQRSIDRNNLIPAFTNMGPIDPESVTFDCEPSNARLLPPPAYPPGFESGLSGYADTLTISAGVYPTQKDVVEHFLDAVVAELPS
jgi:NRPS condensation-like uncharacterized protein